MFGSALHMQTHGISHTDNLQYIDFMCVELSSQLPQHKLLHSWRLLRPSLHRHTNHCDISTEVEVGRNKNLWRTKASICEPVMLALVWTIPNSFPRCKQM